MLILSRKPKQSIHIRDGISVTVLRIHRGTVRLGIDAPRDVPVHREEVLRSLQFASAGPDAIGALRRPR